MRNLSKWTVLYLLFGSAVFILGIFVLNRAGHASKAEGITFFTPECVSNQTSMKIGGMVPALVVTSRQDKSSTLPEMVHGKKTLIAVISPGNNACNMLLNEWSAQTFIEGVEWQPIIIVAGTNKKSLQHLSDEVTARFPVSYCGEKDLNSLCGITTYPTLLGIDRDGTIRFIISGYVSQIDRSFFDRYL